VENTDYRNQQKGEVMNRRTFIQTALGSAFVAASFPRLSWAGGLVYRPNDSDVRDLLLWAPYEAFLPDQTDPQLDDPSDGTETGVLKAADIIKGQSLTLQYWHGHGGVYHLFTVTPDDFTSLKSGHPVIIYEHTTVVEDHYHFVVIDPNKPA
jgi:hypothetical protein